jgi:hypothetical protein
MAPDQAARVLYAVRVLQEMDAMRKSAASANTGNGQGAW